MKIAASTTYTLILESPQEKRELAEALHEAIATLLDATAADPYYDRPHNWRTDPRRLTELYNLLREPDWSPL